MHPYAQVNNYAYIDSQAEFESWCAQYQMSNGKSHILAIDTEFVRTQTLTPLLGLIQVFDGKQLVLIDPIAVTDLASFAKVLVDPKVIKVAHSCSEDLEALWHHLGVIPAPVFDTQFAAGLLDLGISVGYANLVEQLFNISLDKGESRTDWMQRPLSKAQLAYAAADVTHLMALFEHLFALTEQRDITSWVYQEIAQLGLKKSTPVPANTAYLTLKNIWKLSSKSLAAFKELARWRLEEARAKNKSVNFVIKEDAMYEVAVKLPDSMHKLFECKQLYSKPARLYGDIIISICKRAQDLEPAECPPRVQRLIEFSGYKSAMIAAKKLVEDVALQNNIPVATLASKKQINQLLKWYWFNFDELEAQGLKPDLLSSWRYDLLKDSIAELLPKLANHHEIMRSI